MDLRTRKLAKLVINYALKVKPHENVILNGGVEAQEFLKELYKEILLKGAHPILRVGLSDLQSFFYKYAKKHQIEKYPDDFEYLIKKSQKFVGVLTQTNTMELNNSDSKKIVARGKVMYPLIEMISDNKPNMLRSSVGFPCVSLAQDAGMSLTDYENFVYEACLQDWNKVGVNMNKVLNKFRKGKKVHLIGEGVDLRFNIHGEKAMTDLAGENIPMGEVFMAPVRESLEGWIKFDYPAIRGGKEVTDIYLKFENGKVVEATATKNEDFLHEMLKVDDNASYVGEFGIGMNPKINCFTKNLLFDEKMNGTIHLALGMAYKENGGGNDSAIHWDIVKNMRNGKIILDGKVVQNKGKWFVK